VLAELHSTLQLPGFLANKWLDVGVLGKSHLHKTFPDHAPAWLRFTGARKIIQPVAQTMGKNSS